MRPLFTSVSITGTAVSTPQKPEMQSQIADLSILPLMSQPFSSSVCGEWSVAIMSIVAVEQPLPQRVLMLLAAHRRVHLQQRADLLHVGVHAQQIVRRVSAVKRRPRALASLTICAACLVLAWTMCSFVLKVSASNMM